MAAQDSRRFSQERQAAIVARLDREGRVFSATLAEQLEVSMDTIRRDLHELEAEGLLMRVHGGALRPLPGESRFVDRLEADDQGRVLVAQLAAGLLANDEVIALGGGTTAVALARALRPELRATVLTSSLDVALALRGHANLTVDVLGGRLDRESQTLTGAGTVAQIRGVRPGVCVVSPCGLDVAEGVTLRERDEADVVAAMIERSRRIVAVATAAKLGSAGPYVVADAARVDVLVTDAAPAQLGAFRELGIDVVTPEAR
jgi:DeoR/GlpR family transcriptional regulator of sugar metabolism